MQQPKDVTYKNFPFEDVVEKVKQLLEQDPTMLIHQKYTCAGCGARLGMEQPNHFFETGSCDQCDTVTNIRKDGCNFMIHMRLK